MKISWKSTTSLALLILAFTACPRKDEAPAVREAVLNYWNYLYRGEIQEAYDMLAQESKAGMTVQQFSRLVGLGTRRLPEIEDYWKAYFPLTQVRVGDVYVEKKSAKATVVLTQPDPKWFPTRAYEEAEKLSLKETEKALYLLRATTDALNRGEVPRVVITRVMKLVKEGDSWRIIFEKD